MTYKTFILNNLLKHWLLIASLIFLNLITLLWGLSRDRELVLIAVDQNGTRVVSKDTDPAHRQKIINFIRDFVNYAYNFDQGSLEDNARVYANMLSVELWKQKESTVLKLIENIKKEPVSMSTLIRKVSKETDKNGDDAYLILNTQTLTRRGFSESKDYILKIKIAPAKEGTFDITKNPSGLEIIKIEEEETKENK